MSATPHVPTGDDAFDTLDLGDRELFRHGFPHALFARLRREAPVFWHDTPADADHTGGEGFWVLSKHADIQAANRDPETFTSFEGPQLGPRPEMHGRMLVSMDGRDHLRQRALISAGFTPRMVSRLEDKARGWARSIVGEALERGECDFVADLAYQLPMQMIADIVGIPVEDRDWLFDRINQWLQCTDPEHPTPADRQPEIQIEMFAYAQKLGASKRSQPRDDVWTLLSTVEVECEDGSKSRLEGIELDFFFMLLVVAGSETTRNAISHGLLALLEHPDQIETLRSRPDAMPRAVDEILRWSSPVSYFRRRAARDTRIRGVEIAKGDNVTLWYPSGNRDEGAFPDASRFDISRDARSHVAFGGGGPHYCLGANLAKREIAVLFDELLARTLEIEVIGEPAYSVQGLFNPICVSLMSLPVRLAAR